MLTQEKIKKIFKLGNSVTFTEEPKGPYRVKAVCQRYAILTKPYNPQRTVIYTIVDKLHKIRGPNNLIFNMYDYKIQEDIDQCLKDLNVGRNGLAVSIKRKRGIDLNILTYESKI